MSLATTAIILTFSCFSFSQTQHLQFTAESYPDPRTDPITCQQILPGQVCDPHAVLQLEERRLLNEKIIRLQQITANVRNTAPACADNPVANLRIMIALIEKFGNVPPESGHIEGFTNTLRSKYQNYQDTSACDTLVLIVNSKNDRQVFTVAGRDAKLSRDMLQLAFQRNVGHFRSGNYASGLSGMVEYIISSYAETHIIVTEPSPISESLDKFANVPNAHSPDQGLSFAHSVQQKTVTDDQSENFDFEAVPEEERLWLKMLSKATSSCGYDKEKIVRHVRAVVEEAMEISLKLISNPQYNKIEEEAQNPENQPYAREKAWKNLKPFLSQIYTKYGRGLKKKPNQCPMLKENEYMTMTI